ncbi:DUF2249 domain-containing protein [Paenibacillus macerans]|uniref:DUF2249 domain-containing protein n=1 Tax=Paenibacillus macerans TaxID=44252 RepID=UPI00203FC66C|nr:DUF2249 domain-containing protein [Paenibacillus macerans]MCM3699003.1 DUF2249 domain-containing protein [Paenibacillus macerans]
MNRNEAKVVELDVRPYLRKKTEPFQIIMDTVKTLGNNDIFVLHATFKPTPLLGLLKMKGLVGKAVEQGPEHWVTTFVHKSNKSWLDESAPVPEEQNTNECGGESSGSLSAGKTARAEEPPATGQTPKTVELDNRGLEPPQPMVRTLAALGRCRSGDEVHIHNDRVPVFLIEELNGMGCSYTIEEQPDGSAKVKIRKP